jgi:hypothetical protein
MVYFEGVLLLTSDASPNGASPMGDANPNDASPSPNQGHWERIGPTDLDAIQAHIPTQRSARQIALERYMYRAA